MDATIQKPKTKDERAKLVEAIETRVNRAIRAIRLIGKLDSRKALDIEDVEVMHEALGDEVDAMVMRLRTGCKSEPDWQRYHSPAHDED